MSVREKRMRPKLVRALLICALLGANSAIAQQIEDKLVIVTSFSKDVTSPFQQAFEKKYPGTKVEVQNRNSAAAIAFIRETRSSPPDIFWASSPDAFEVLKKNSLLQKYQPKAQGLASKVGVYPVNDPKGFYVGFAASGYGIMFNTRYTRANGLPAPKGSDMKVDRVNAGRYAAVRFSGKLTDKVVKDAEQRLRTWAGKQGMKLAGNAIVAGYDPPFTPPPMRRKVFLPCANARPRQGSRCPMPR